MADRKTTRMTRSEAKAFVARWKAVNAAEIEELRSTPVAQRLRQVAALMASGLALDWDAVLPVGEDEVRRRWNRLRRVAGVS